MVMSPQVKVLRTPHMEIEWNIAIYVMVDQNSFIRERPFFANKQIISRTPCLSFAEPMLSNNSSYEDSFISCQSHKIITDNFFIAL